MPDNKTQPSTASVEHYVDAIDDAVRREDCRALAALMADITGEPARMWGAAIVGFGARSYRYDSGREGRTFRIGFSSRKGDISLYGLGSTPRMEALFASLGKHKRGKECLYVSRLDDVDPEILKQLLAEAARHS